MGKRVAEESPPGAPAWVVTFSDMITLLLTFFVMLLSMATVQVEEHKFEMGQASLQRSLNSFGMASGQAGTTQSTQFEHPKPQYATAESEDEPENRSIDARTEMLRRVVLDIEKMAKVTPSAISGANRMYLPTDIHFEVGQTELNDDAKIFLKNYSEQLAANLAGQEATIYVLGIAAKESKDRQQWVLSAQRAKTVADFIRRYQSDESRWTIYSWGAGAGGDWIGEKGLVSAQTEIMIAVLTENQLQ